MHIPIIFVHTGDAYYLDFSLNQAHLSNPDNDIYLITDRITNKYSFVKYIDINAFNVSAKQFEKIYKHMSTNSYEAELFCFQRWFVINEFLEKHQLNNFLYLDSDLMLYCKADEYFSNFNSFQFTITNKQGPQCSYFSSAKYLKQFCDFITKMYTEEKHMARFEARHLRHIQQKLNGGICDMTAFIEYQKDFPGSAKDLSVLENNSVFDDNFNFSDGFEMANAGKKIVFENNSPYGFLKGKTEKVKFNSLHFQGPAKKYMYQYYLGNNLNDLKRKIKRDFLIMKNYFLFRVFRKLGYQTLKY
jgi:hypothetical protein